MFWMFYGNNVVENVKKKNRKKLKKHKKCDVILSFRMKLNNFTFKNTLFSRKCSNSNLL